MKPLFLCGAFRSGTTLLLSLLDSHPSLCAFPTETYFSHTISECDSLEQKKERLLSRILGREEIRKRGESFEDLLKSEISKATNDQELFYSCFRALCNLLDTEIDQYEYLVEKTPKNNQRFAPLLMELFPDAKFIHIFRDPRDIFASRFKTQVKEKRLKSVLAMHERWNKCVRNSLRFKGDQKHFFLKYEDLVKDPKEVTRSVCEFLNIPWDEKMLSSTLAGQTWQGNSFQGEKSGGQIHSRSLGKYKEILSKSQQKRLEELCFTYLDQLGYEVEYGKRERGLPMWYRVYKVFIFLLFKLRAPKF